MQQNSKCIVFKPLILVQAALLEDYKKTNTCRFSLAEQQYDWSNQCSFAVAKKSPYAEQLNKG